MNQGSVKVLFVVPTLSQPRYHKRAKQILKFAQVSVMGFQRQYYNENGFPDEVPLMRLGQLADGRYLKRLGNLVGAMGALRKGRASQNVFYAFGLDCYLMARLAGFPRGVIEIGDLRAVDAGYLVRGLESWVINDAKAVVVTSPRFHEYYFGRDSRMSSEKGFIIENKVPIQLSNQRPASALFFSNRRLRIGLVGLLRYRKPIELLLGFVKKHSTLVELHCYGDGPFKVLVQESVGENITYHGSFKSPEDLPRIYANIDLNYVVYDVESENVRLALPNKLYESAFFGVPILCAAETALGKVAEEWGIGRPVPITDSYLFERALLSANKIWIQNASQAALKVSTDNLVENDSPTILKILEAVSAH